MSVRQSREPIAERQILTGPQFNEAMRVLMVSSTQPGFWSLGLVGQQTQRFRQVTLSADDIARLEITDPALSFDGDGHLLRLGLRAHALGIAHEFDPYFGLSISHVDPLPHQLEAVYEHLLKAPTVRFLLADDAGAGKTIMAGLLVRALKLRGLIERVLVVCPEILEAAEDIARSPPSIPSEMEMEDAEREKLEKILDAMTLASNPEQVRAEIRELKRLAEEARAVEQSGAEAKLSHPRRILQDEGFFANRDQRLLVFTEYKDTLNYLVERLREWGFSVGC